MMDLRLIALLQAPMGAEDVEMLRVVGRCKFEPFYSLLLTLFWQYEKRLAKT